MSDAWWAAIIVFAFGVGGLGLGLGLVLGAFVARMLRRYMVAERLKGADDDDQPRGR